MSVQQKLGASFHLINVMLTRIFILIWFGVLLVFPSTLPAQDETPNPEARLLSPVSDGSPAPEAPEKTLPQYDIHWSKVHFKDGRKITINRVEPPSVIETQIEPSLTSENSVQQNPPAEPAIESGGMVLVSATIYDHKTTYVTWTHDGEGFFAVSNVD